MPRSAMLVPILVLGLVSTVHSQSSSRASARDVLERQMSAVEQTIARTGYRPVPGAIHFSYDEDLPNLESPLAGTNMGLEVVLKSGMEYEISAAGCGLWLQDIHGNALFTGPLDSDGLEAVLRFTAPADGAHFLVVDCLPTDGEWFPGAVYRVESKSQADSSFTFDPGAYPADIIVGLLNSGGTAGFGVHLELGVEYMIVGVCDQNCGGLDLSLSDSERNVLFTDELDDDAPVLQFTSATRDYHTLWVTMYACSIEPCSFAYQVFRR